jgi:hypothetical protein
MVLGFFKETCFLFCWWLGVFPFNNMEIKFTEWRRDGVDNIETLVSFSFVWYVCVAIGHKMSVWQESCQMKCTQRKSHSATTKGCASL